MSEYLTDFSGIAGSKVNLGGTGYNYTESKGS